MLMLGDTPGVQLERVDATAPRIAGVRTDIAAFVGIARQGPVGVAVPIESLRQFDAHFGAPTGAGYLAYSVRAFLENGGRRCWVVRTAGADARAASLVVPDVAGNPAWRLAASSPGVWGDGLSVRLRRSRAYETVSVVGSTTARYATVASLTGFRRGSLVEIAQPGATTLRRVVSAVDEARQRVYWVHPDPGAGLPYDEPAPGFDLAKPLELTSVEFELLVSQLGRVISQHAGLSLVYEHPDYGPRRLAAGPWSATTATDTLPAPPPPVVIEALAGPAGIPVPLAPIDAPEPLAGGRDGLRYLVADDFIGDRDAAAGGIAALSKVDEVAIVAVPDIAIRPELPPVYEPLPRHVDPCFPAPPTAANPPPAPGELPPVFSDADIARVYAALIEHCEAHDDRIALLDTPFERAQPTTGSVGAVRDWRRLFETRHAALYYPWLEVPDPLGIAPTRAIPPSGHVAGQYAAADLEVGVHRAAANKALRWVQGTTLALDDAAHGLLNRDGINAIRPLPGRGIRILGARTVSSDPSWSFVPVQRLVMMIKKALELSTQWTVFEPNDAHTRLKVQMSLDSYLRALWQKGSFAGAVPAAAFFVKCNAANNPSDTREGGQLIAEVGIAPAVPFEFVLVRIGREGNQLHVAEVGSLKGANTP